MLTKLENVDFYEEFYGGFSKEHITACIISVVLYFVLPDIVNNLILHTPSLYNWFAGTTTNFQYIFSIVLQDGAVFILILAVFGKYILRSLKAYLGVRFAEFSKSVGLVALFYLASRFVMLLLSPITVIFGQNQNQNQETITTVTQSIPVLMVVVAVLVGPVVEEVIFRWGIFRPIYKHSPALAYIISSGLFAFAHIAQSVFAGNFYEFANFPLYFAVGFSMALIYKITRNFSAPLLLHILNNALSMALIIFAL